MTNDEARMTNEVSKAQMIDRPRILAAMQDFVIHSRFDIRASTFVLCFIGAGRDRTLACQIKSLLCCLYTTTPDAAGACVSNECG